MDLGEAVSWQFLELDVAIHSVMAEWIWFPSWKDVSDG